MLWLVATVMGFTACAPRGTPCEYRELEAPSQMACTIAGQIAATEWLHENGLSEWQLKQGWKCFVNTKGENA